MLAAAHARQKWMADGIPTGAPVATSERRNKDDSADTIDAPPPRGLASLPAPHNCALNHHNCAAALAEHPRSLGEHLAAVLSRPDFDLSTGQGIAEVIEMAADATAVQDRIGDVSSWRLRWFRLPAQFTIFKRLRMKSSDIINAPCRRCTGYTRHSVLAIREVYEGEDTDDGFNLFFRSTYAMIQCCGCESVKLLEREDHPSRPESFSTHYYPPPLARRVPEWHFRLTAVDPDIFGLLEEVYSAMHADNRRLALMGIRAIVDMVLNDKIGTSGSFRDRLEELESQGHISRNNHIVLGKVLEAGHAAAHRGFRPSTTDLGRCLDIVENVLQSLYLLGEDGEELGNVTPPRAD